MFNINEQSTRKQNAIALGDPAGIGIEVTLKALKRININERKNQILIGCRETVKIIYNDLLSKGIDNLADPTELNIIDMPINKTIIPGKPNSISGKAGFEWLTYAAKLVNKGEANALVTAPISKHIWDLAGHKYPGQTERLKEITNAKDVSMLFTAVSPISGWRLNTLLATTHIPLSKVKEKLTDELIINKLNTLLRFCKQFNKSPQISVAGLNPHAGEEGRLGKEEISWLIPLIKQWESMNPDANVIGPISPDTCWISAAKAWQGSDQTNCPDGFLALYHDQGLIPVKLIAFDYAVNTTLGLPFIRTSPDHGTGFDIAGKGLAKEESMLAAINTAKELS